MMFTDSIVQKEGLGLDKAVEEVKYRMARCTSCSTHSSTALASHFYDTDW